MMKAATWLLGSLLAGAVSLTHAQIQEVPPDTTTWKIHLQQMKETQTAWERAGSPEEQDRLIHEHWQRMQTGGEVMGCPIHKMMPLHADGSGNARTPTVPELDEQIARMELLLEHLRSHRDMVQAAQGR